MKRIGANLVLVSALVSLAGCFAGCATNPTNGAPDAARIARVQTLCTIAAKDGTILALQAYPQYQPVFEAAFVELDSIVSTGSIVPAQLADILKQLNVKALQGQQATILIGDLPLLVDLIGPSSGANTPGQIDLTRAPYVLAAATGIRDGMKQALGK